MDLCPVQLNALWAPMGWRGTHDRVSVLRRGFVVLAHALLCCPGRNTKADTA